MNYKGKNSILRMRQINILCLLISRTEKIIITSGDLCPKHVTVT